MAVSEDLHKLTDRAKEAEEKAATASQQAKAELEKTIKSARESVQANTARLGETAKASQGKISSTWGDQQQAWSAHVERMRQGMDERKARLEAKGAEKGAEEAEADAYFAISFAYNTIEAAEYAVLDAIQAREEAYEAASAIDGRAQ